MQEYKAERYNYTAGLLVQVDICRSSGDVYFDVWDLGREL